MVEGSLTVMSGGTDFHALQIDEQSCIFLRQGSYCFCDGVRELIEKEQYKNI